MSHPFSYATVETLSGARTITAAEAAEQSIWAFDPGGAGRTLTLPAEATSAGYVLFIANAADGAEVLTVQDDGTNTIVTPTQNESCIVSCDGSAWHGLVGAESYTMLVKWPKPEQPTLAKQPEPVLTVASIGVRFNNPMPRGNRIKVVR